MKKYKPTSKSQRMHSTISYGDILTTGNPEKSLTHGFRRSVGRNHHGKITTRHKGAGHKKLFREIDFRYDKIGVPYTIKTVEYDPNRSAFIGLAQYRDGEKRYVLVPQGVKVGQMFLTSDTAEPKTGNRLPLKVINVGTFVYNVEAKPQGGAKFGRSAGNFLEVIAKDAGMVDLKMPSSEVRKVKETCWASIGVLSNEENRLVNLGKAGRSRWLGIRPTVRGTAMNPVDHPHGGGEGRQGRGRRRAVSAWGRPTGKGQKTRTPKKYSNKFIVSRRKVGKRK